MAESKPTEPKLLEVKFADLQPINNTNNEHCLDWQFPNLPHSYGRTNEILTFTANLQQYVKNAGFKYSVIDNQTIGSTIQLGIQVGDLYVNIIDWKGWYMVGWSTRKLTDIETKSVSEFLKKIYLQ